MKVLIVGAGISGLYSAYLLERVGIEVEIFEASNRVGGRILSVEDDNGDFSELGAEVVYAPQAPLMKLLKKLNISLRRYNELSYFYYKRTLYSENQLHHSKSLNAVIQAIDDIEDYKGAETSLTEYIRSLPFYNSEMDELVNAFACEYGTTAQNIDVKSLAFEETQWQGGEDEFCCQQPLNAVWQYFQDNIHCNVYLNTQVKSITCLDNGISITDQNNHISFGDKVLVSVNLGILKSKDIQFTPPLPTNTLQAIDGIGIDAGLKIVMKFGSRWWPDDLMTIEGGSICNEYLASRNYDSPALTGFIMGEKLKDVSSLSTESLTSQLLAELNKIFSHSMATTTFVSSQLKNWGDDEFHKGAYSYASRNSPSMRSALSESIDNKLFFIGEACNTNGHAATIHGAMETAEKVVKKLSVELKARKKPVELSEHHNWIKV